MAYKRVTAEERVLIYRWRKDSEGRGRLPGVWSGM